MTEDDVARAFQTVWDSLFADRDFPKGDNHRFHVQRTGMGAVDTYAVDVIVYRYDEEYRILHQHTRSVRVPFWDWFPDSTKKTCSAIAEACRYAKSLLYPTPPAGKWRLYSRSV